MRQTPARRLEYTPTGAVSESGECKNVEDLTGKQLGPYQITAPLGEGGMAAVYKAYQPAMDRYVALKVLPRHFASDPQFVTRFQQEARVVAQLQHPHILPVFDFGEADGYTYIVMPFVKSGTLTDLLKGPALSLPQIRTLVTQIGSALDYAHARGLVHRDVKPSNVLIDETGNCLLTDFGLAKIMEGSIHLTTSGAIMGTPAYMSPEQGLGHKIDKRSDIYALGVILYEMAVGRVPYSAETPMAVVIKHINDPLPPPRSVKPELPEALERVTLKALTKNPEDRFASAGEMVRALQAAIPETTLAAAPPVAEPLTSETVKQPPPLQRKTEQAAAARDRTLAPSERAKSKALVWVYVIAGLVIIACVAGVAIVGGKAANDRAATQTAAYAGGLPTNTALPGKTSIAPTQTKASVPSATRVLPTATSVPPSPINAPTAQPTATRPKPTPTKPAPTRAAPATATAAGTEATNWRVDFSYRFPPDYWSVGAHQYTLVSNCPGLPPESSNSWTNSFDVSEGAAVLPGDVYLRLGGLRHEGTPVSAIHPSQPTVAQLSWVEMTKSDAEQYVAVCTTIISWDGGAPVTLTAGTPYQQ